MFFSGDLGKYQNFSLNAKGGMVKLGDTEYTFGFWGQNMSMRTPTHYHRKEEAFEKRGFG
ncbi:MAG: hypothetical protein BAA01_09410 [Bacillus thermozeamaize]|uniref:Uncharacterized protein n=1 Tax=Bacillus thermozeamaize TaxID=230954 RepID=A0A1Y3PHT1_9BACI|nr:MAG: hypothetical protein BAA01_09410 [Bacillus thermozeamaize]